jgi:hypothetical protein
VFCDALIDYSLYRGLVPATTVEGIPPYLMSFVCHPDGYRRERKVQTKHDVPLGLCDEYLLKFQFGFHLDTDIIDTLHEYWHDRGNFGGPLYPHQPLFPWDYTEAYGRSLVRYGDCNTAKHAWAFPFDSWSMAELHLTRGAVMYPRPAAAGRLDGQPPGCLAGAGCPHRRRQSRGQQRRLPKGNGLAGRQRGPAARPAEAGRHPSRLALQSAKDSLFRYSRRT